MASASTDSALKTASRRVVENLLRVEQLQELIAEVEANGEDPTVFLGVLSLFEEKLAEWRAVHQELERLGREQAAAPAELAYERS